MSVVSDASSSRGSVDTDALPPSRSSTSASVSSLPHSHSHSHSHTHSHTLSTKERRRERNRLAAQKHRLRRNERMSQLEQQVLALQHEKSQLLQRVDVVKSSVGDEKMRDVDEEEMPRAKRPRSASPDPQHPHVHPHALHPNSPPPHYTPTTNSHANGHGHGHGHSTAAPGYASTVAAAIADPDTLRRMEDRILELERWSEDLNGDLADALDSSARLTTDLHRACAASDAHARRAADVERTLKAERARHASQVADLMEAVEAQLSAAKMFKGANARMRESVEAAEETLGVLRAENGRLRARLAVVEANGGAGAGSGSSGDDDHLATIARLQDDLRETRAELEGARGDARRQRKLLREQESQEANAAEQRQRTKAREEAERRHAETALAALTARAESAEQAAAKQQREVESVRRAREESEVARRALEGSLEKIGSFLRTKGIAVTSEDERDEDGGGGGDGGYGYGVGR